MVSKPPAITDDQYLAMVDERDAALTRVTELEDALQALLTLDAIAGIDDCGRGCCDTCSAIRLARGVLVGQSVEEAIPLVDPDLPADPTPLPEPWSDERTAAYLGLGLDDYLEIKSHGGEQ
jgi:hypothetical protein